jgi:membrane protease YdiL (CAAX protease family)
MKKRRRRPKGLQHLVAVLPKPITHVAGIGLPETPYVRRRRQQIVAGTAVGGAALLGASLSTEPGSREFYASTAGVALVWAAGGALSGPLHLGWIETRDSTLRRPLITPVATGVGAFALFYGAALVARRIPVLDQALTAIMRFADEGDDTLVMATTLANGLAEEIFFRGALYSALGNHTPVAASTGIYAIATTTTRNPALVLAATVMGTLFGLQRRASGGIQAPVITHLTWSSLMVRFVPPLFRSEAEGTRA